MSALRSLWMIDFLPSTNTWETGCVKAYAWIDGAYFFVGGQKVMFSRQGDERWTLEHMT